MKTIDKIRSYIRSISSTEDEYNKLLDNIWINPEQRVQTSGARNMRRMFSELFQKGTMMFKELKI